ncbi:hypothetical protein [Microbacterium sp.]|uniref:hypothetical protein n=1 Tax=Microbacterium sp. TaxID=51671 RepID=UPI0026139D40|nr:hypothetical protein [Microbacterium sp.]
MSTSDQHGKQPLTRKQLREIRLTGATPVISDEEAAAAAEADAESAAPETAPAPEAPAPAPRPDAEVNLDERPLTRRQIREQERIRTASVPVVDFDTSADESSAATSVDEAPVDEPSVEEIPVEEIAVEESPIDESPVEEPAVEETSAEVVAEEEEPAAVVDAEEDPEIVLGVPTFAAQAAGDTDADDDDRADQDDRDDEEGAASDFEGLIGADDSADSGEDDDDVDPIATGEHPVVSSAFGKGVQADVPAFAPSFDELISSGAGGSQNHAPNTLIFTPLPGRGSLSGPIASTGELLITGSYELPNGIGSQGHAHGAADGKDVDAVLIDGELPASSSPTPIAASSAVSTTKPAGEVIRPPAPEKGNKLMLTLAIMAGGLALALAVVLIVAFTMNLF